MERLTDEVWRPVVGYEQFYEVSSLGNVRHRKTRRLRHLDYSTVYPTIVLSAFGEHKRVRVHRLVAKAFLVPVYGKTDVNHKNGNHADNRVENLEYVTPSENNIHAYRVLHKRPSTLGRESYNRKVSEADIHRIYTLHKAGIPSDEIGAMYGVDGSTIRRHLNKYRNENQN